MSHLYKLGLENFRVFKEYTEIEFAPITVFTGANNSGKSSVVKAIQLLKSNLFAYKSESDLNLSFISGEHKLIGFKDIVNDLSKPLKFVTSTIMDGNDEILSIALSYKIDKSNALGQGIIDCIELFSDKNNLVFKYDRSSIIPSVFTDFKYFYHKMIQGIKRRENDLENYKTIEETTTNLVDPKLIYHPYRLPSCFLMNYPHPKHKLHFNPIPLNYHTGPSQSNSIVYKPRVFKEAQMLSPTLITSILIIQGIIDLKLLVEKYKIPNQDITDEILKTYLKKELGKANPEIKNLITQTEDLIIDILYEIEKSHKLDGKSLSGIENMFELYISNQYHIADELGIELISNIYRNESTEVISKALQQLMPNIASHIPDNLDYFLRDYLGKNLSLILQNASKYFEGVFKIDSQRADTQRLYTYASQGTSFNSLLLESLQLNLLNNYNSKKFLNEWLNKFGIKGNFEILNSLSGAGMEVKIGGRPLADLGYGITQLIPILLKIISTENRYHDDDYHTKDPDYDFYVSHTIIIEEPESNLHPRYQSLLADLFVDASRKYTIQFIIETHSEYLIRKLQYLTAKGDLTPADTALYYFYHPDEKPDAEDQVKKIEIQQDGRLSSGFGEGFFDEADNLAIKLFVLNSNSSN